MNALSLNRLTPGSSAEDRRDFAENFNATLDQLGVKPGESFVIAVVDDVPPPSAGHCRHCREPVDPDQAWRRQSVYARRGATALREEHLDDLACETCISRLKRGISPAQTSLYPSTEAEFDEAMPMLSGREAEAAQRRHEERLAAS